MYPIVLNRARTVKLKDSARGHKLRIQTLCQCSWLIKSSLFPTDLSWLSHCFLNYQSDSWDTGKRWWGNTCSNSDQIFQIQRIGNCCFFRQIGSLRIVTYTEMKNSDPFSVTSAILYITVQRQNKKTTLQKPQPYKTNQFQPSIQKWTENVSMRQFNLINKIFTFPDENVSGAFRGKTCPQWRCYMP